MQVFEWQTRHTLGIEVRDGDRTSGTVRDESQVARVLPDEHSLARVKRPGGKRHPDSLC